MYLLTYSGMSDVAWHCAGVFRLYLSGRTFRVMFSGTKSSIVHIVCSPTRLSAGSRPSAATADKHSISLHAFADDTQMYLRCRRVDCRPTGTVHCRHRPLDVRKLTQT